MADKDILGIPVSSPICAGDLSQAYTKEGKPYPIIFRAPIDMEPGDLCIVNSTDATLYEIIRGGVTIFENKESYG